MYRVVIKPEKAELIELPSGMNSLDDLCYEIEKAYYRSPDTDGFFNDANAIAQAYFSRNMGAYQEFRRRVASFQDGRPEDVTLFLEAISQ